MKVWGIAGLIACGATGLLSARAANDTDIDLNAHWAGQAFFNGPRRDAIQSRAYVVHEDVAGDTKPGRCSAGGPMRLGGKTHEHGVGVNSRSVIRVTLAKPAKSFSATVGLDNNAANTAASVRFHVSAKNADVFATEVMRANDAPQFIEVPLNGATEFDLAVDVGEDDRGWDQGDWADARVSLENGESIYLDDLMRGWNVETTLPFSFVYGGHPSTEFIGTWTKSIHDESATPGLERHTLALADPAGGLEVRAVCTTYLDTPGVDWTLYFANHGPADTPIVEQIKPLDLSIHPGVRVGSTVVHRLNGGPCQADDWLPFDSPVAHGGRLDIAATNGRSSNVCPFFNVDFGGGGAIVAVGWSGQWAASVEDTGPFVRIGAGMATAHFVLHPGETLRGPRIGLMFWKGNDPWPAYNEWRRTMLTHVLPRRDGAPIVPPIAHLSTSFYEMNATTEANAMSHLDSIKGLGFETFWLDAYWTRDGFPAGMGHYGFPLDRVEPRDRFPNGIRPVSDAVHAAGMQFLMWFEPERVYPGTLIAKEHPEWSISPSGDGSGLFNLGIPEARDYMTKYLIAAVQAYKLEWLRIDYNIDPLTFWRFLDKPDPNRAGVGEIRYVEGLYRMWDDILAACPGLAIDDCASGGRRIDLETCSRSIPLWRTDATIDPLFAHNFNQAALQNQVMTAGLNRFVPFSVSGQMGAEPYLFRSGFNGGIAFAEDCRKSGYPRDLLRQAIAEAKRIRTYCYGDFYCLSGVTMDPRDWLVLQYHRPHEQDGAIIAFRRHDSPYTGYTCIPRGIDPNADYSITVSSTYEQGVPAQMKGQDLLHYDARIDTCPGSLIIEYKKATEK